MEGDRDIAVFLVKPRPNFGGDTEIVNLYAFCPIETLEQCLFCKSMSCIHASQSHLGGVQVTENIDGNESQPDENGVTSTTPATKDHDAYGWSCSGCPFSSS